MTAKPIVLAGLIMAVGAAFYFYTADDARDKILRSDTASLDVLGWGESAADLRSRYTGAGTAVAALGYRNIERISGCEAATRPAAERRNHRFAMAETGIEQCTVSLESLALANQEGNQVCLDAIEAAANNWQSNWDPRSESESPYEFQDVYPYGDVGPDGTIALQDKVHTIEQLAGWPVGDPAEGYANSPTVWDGDYKGWSPADNDTSCPIVWAQCFDEKTPLYKGVNGLAALGENEGQCIIELAPGIRNGMARYGTMDIVRETAPDTQIVVASFAENREDSMSRAADWLIDNQQRFNIVAARTSNVVLLETRLLNPGLQQVCAGTAWCDRVSYAPYLQTCSGNPYADGKAYAHKSMPAPPQSYKPIAYQYERMRDAGIVAIKGAGHEGWKAALPYPDCSPALVTVSVVYAGTIPPITGKNKNIEDGWVSQGWRWDPAYYCEEKTVQQDQVACATNNAPDMGYGLSNGETVSPLMVVHPRETFGDSLGNAWTTPYVMGAVAVLKSNNLAPNLNVTEVMDIIHASGTTIVDDRKCDQDPQTPEPDGWMRIGLDFFDIELAPLETGADTSLTERELQLLRYPWAYACTDAESPDTAPFHTDNVAEFSNQRLDIGAAVQKAMELSDENQAPVTTTEK